MKVFLSYTTRDGSVNKKTLSAIEKRLSRYCEVFIDILHNKAKDWQAEVIAQLRSSDLFIQIRTPMIEESPWAVLEQKEASKQGIKCLFVESDIQVPIVDEIERIVKSIIYINLTYLAETTLAKQGSCQPKRWLPRR